MSEMKGLDKLIIDSQQKLGSVYLRYRELERNCQYFINRYNEDTEQVRSLKQSLANKNLNYELRLRLRAKLDSVEKRKGQRSQKLAKKKQLLTKIQANMRSVDKLRIDQENVKKLKAQEERDRKELIRLQQSVESYDKQCRAGLKKIDSELDYYLNALKSNEFAV
ncbi:hypothetical protein DEAC_c43060 [Desulfosporosinus acididurans]|uniref:Chromosome partition protein Smc n=1 Tax=Desulfosporosinus acididurans TaxID=476652 RepID=A0A0J1FK18_9FIRM|nr:hypothetical protein [Desulfosporosinus acididurans]KLU63777.1 hypothetical protein DEAC_c43060 [Desulfosporosinus acididurans]